jgi:protein arginine N-methyltransferase 2
MEQKIFSVCGFEIKPIVKENYLSILKECLNEVPPTITTHDVELSKVGEKESDRKDTGTTPLHRICQTFDAKSSDPEVLDTAHAMIDCLFLHGANWMMLDDNDNTPGCIALERNLPTSIYDKFVAAGTRAEVLLRRLIDESDKEDQQEEDHLPGVVEEDTSDSQEAYLKSKLQYSQHNLVTEKQHDGIMMDWETPIMKRSAELISSTENAIVLNVGFGMGIIDTFIQSHKPAKHYICEAHPDVLAKLKKDGWYEKPNVVILEGRWQDTLPKLLEQGVQVDGIYYDTFSEHYKHLVKFYDIVVGLLAPTGVFSFFNGLGADRQICYDVYKQVVEVDVQDYGMKVNWTKMAVDSPKGRWDGIRRQYWKLSEYWLPEIRFLDV